MLGLCCWHTAVWANRAPSHTTSYFLANCCPHKHPQPRACMTLDVHHDFFLWTKARQRAVPRRAGAVQHPCSAPLGDMHSPGLPPEPPCSRLPPEPGAPSQASWRPGTARHRPCCHGEDFCATSHTKEIAPSLGCSANEEEEEKSGERAGSLPFFRSLFLAGGNDIKKKRQKRKWRGVGGARPLPCQMTKPLAAEQDLCVCSCPCIEALLGDGSKAAHLLKEPRQQVTSRAACPSLVSQPPVPSEGLHLHPALLGAARLPLGSTVGSWGYMASKTPPSLCSPPAQPAQNMLLCCLAYFCICHENQLQEKPTWWHTGPLSPTSRGSVGAQPCR